MTKKEQKYLNDLIVQRDTEKKDLIEVEKKITQELGIRQGRIMLLEEQITKIKSQNK